MQDLVFHCSLDEQITLAGLPLLRVSGQWVTKPHLGRAAPSPWLSVHTPPLVSRDTGGQPRASHQRGDSRSPGQFFSCFKITFQEETTILSVLSH